MKALTLRHPWAFAIAHLGKTVENREWDDRLVELMGVQHLVGERIAIHGGTAPQRPRRRTVLPTNPWAEFTRDLHHIRRHILHGELPDPAAQYLAQQPSPLTPEAFILPGIVALATVQGVTRSSRDPWAAQGCLHILLSDVITLPEPVQVPGAQGFWTVPPVVEAEVLRGAGIRREQPREQWNHLDGAAWLG